MENDDDLWRRIWEPIVPNIMNVENDVPDSIVPHGRLKRDFFQNIETVLSAKRVMIYKRWENFFAVNCFKALSTHEMYFKYVMFTCDFEVRLCDNIFHKIISVIAIIINFNIETLINSSVDFSHLSFDIFMVFYKSALKESFYNQGGFEQFFEYLRCHEYLPWRNYMHNNLDVSNVYMSNKDSFLENLQNKAGEENEKASDHPNFIKHNDVIRNTICESLAKEVLLTTEGKLPPLTNPSYLKARLQAAGQYKLELRTEISKHQSMRAVSDGKITDTCLKHKKKAKSSNIVTTVALSKNKKTAEPSEPEKMSAFSKCKSTSESAKRDTTSEKRKMVAAESAKHKMGATSTSITTAACFYTSIREAKTASSADTVSKQKASEAAFIPKTTETVLKQKASYSHSKSTKEESSKCETNQTVFHEFVNLGPEYQTNNAIKDGTVLDWCENIVRAVIKYNNSKCLDQDIANDPIQREADTLLTQLKGTITSMIDALDDYGEGSTF